MKSIVSLSFPRSGATWIQYFCRYMLGMGTDFENVDSVIGRSKYCKVHVISDIESVYVEKLICIVRNYKEAIPRHFFDKEGFCFPDCLNPQHWPSYTFPLIFYDNFNGDKLLIYYEDIIEKFEDVAFELVDFLDLDDEKCHTFLRDINEHKKISKGNYVDRHHPSSGGDKRFFHIHKLGKERSLMWDSIIKQRYPNLFYKYLSHYEGYPEG